MFLIIKILNPCRYYVSGDENKIVYFSTWFGEEYASL